jgi:acetate kinase
MNIFVLNCGSSSLKFQIIDTDLERIENDEDLELARGIVERIGSQSVISFKATGSSPYKSALPLRDHTSALKFIIDWVTSPESNIPGINSLEDIHAIGHRTVHGGEKFKKSVRITDEVIKGIEDCIDLAQFCKVFMPLAPNLVRAFLRSLFLILHSIRHCRKQHSCMVSLISCIEDIKSGNMVSSVLLTDL